MSPKFRPLADGFYVSPQIKEADIAAAAALGVTLIVNNRPDGEEPGQPTGSAIEAAARRAGLAYVAIPVAGVATLGVADIDAFDRAVGANPGAVLAYCRSGTRSTVMRALSRARAGDSVDAIIEEAAEAGYDLTGLAPRLAAIQAG